MTTTTDLSQFGRRELRLAAELLAAYVNDPPEWLGNGVTVMLNQSSGYVFLTDEDLNVAMINGGKLDAFLSTPYEGREGFIDEWLDDDPSNFHREDAQFIRDWAERLDADLPTAWTTDGEAEE